MARMTVADRGSVMTTSTDGLARGRPEAPRPLRMALRQDPAPRDARQENAERHYEPGGRRSSRERHLRGAFRTGARAPRLHGQLLLDRAGLQHHPPDVPEVGIDEPVALGGVRSAAAAGRPRGLRGRVRRPAGTPGLRGLGRPQRPVAHGSGSRPSPR